MLKIYLARHGQNQDNVEHILNGHRNRSLSELGEKQAEELATKIADSNIAFDTIYTSPLIRASQTAEIVSEKIGGPKPTVWHRLIERDFGILEGQLQSRIMEICGNDNVIQSEKITYFLDPKGAESWPDLLRRAQRILEVIQFHHQDGNILLVSHGDIGKAIYAQYYGLDWKEVLTSFHFGNSDLLLMSEASKSDDYKTFEIIQGDSV